MFRVFDLHGELIAACEPGVQETSRHIGYRSENLIDLLIDEGFRIEMQGKEYYREEQGVDPASLPLLRAEFTEN